MGIIDFICTVIFLWQGNVRSLEFVWKFTICNIWIYVRSEYITWGFKRFIARKRTPETIISDDFNTFKSGAVKRYMLHYGVPKRFILPASPWWGGFYERLVWSQKLSLKKIIIGKALLAYEELLTLLCDIEKAINSRSFLVYVSEDDMIDAITLIHSIFGQGLLKPRRVQNLVMLYW